ncbi:PIN domain-containing protein [Candidatus Woesearchaeota archaeon]|nr:hypothetical protein [uncultured archaeon]AQS32261.1 hypothetical protein [uncultured archaeon]MBS3149379.1 PIN domain-containing protein [Candidatus Woesearchaeota archaeon]
MILDTTFIIDLLNNDPSAVDKAKYLEKANLPVFTTAVTVFEIWQGTSDIKSKQKLDNINTLLESLGLLDLDLESAKIGGKLHSELYAQGNPIQPEDSMIAGICIKNNKKLLTRNIKHFSKIKKLQIETY